MEMKLLAMFLVVAVVHSECGSDRDDDYADYYGPSSNYYEDYSDSDEDKETDNADEDKETDYEDYDKDYGDSGDYDDVDMCSCPSGYTLKPITHYKGNNIKCGYKSPNLIRDDCDKDSTCIGFSIYAGKPRCTKSGGDGSKDYGYKMCIKQGMRRAVTSTEDEFPAPHVTQRVNIRGH